jgi:hypothetical protein
VRQYGFSFYLPCDFAIEQMRRVKRLARAEEAFFHLSCRGCAHQRFEEGRGVNYDQLRSRSARTACAGSMDSVVWEIITCHYPVRIFFIDRPVCLRSLPELEFSSTQSTKCVWGRGLDIRRAAWG